MLTKNAQIRAGDGDDSQGSLGEVLAVMAPPERELFFPGAGHSRSGFGWEWLDPTGWDRARWREAVRTKKPAVIVANWSTPKILDEFLTAHGGSVAYVCNVTGSVRELVTRAEIAAGLLVTNWGSITASIVAEHAVLLTLAALRNLAAWPKRGDDPGSGGFGRFQTRTLTGKRVGIFGFGAIARALVDLLRPFAPQISAYSVGCAPSAIVYAGVDPAKSLAELFAGSEVLICCESLTEKSRGCVDAGLLALLPRGAVLVNVGRGAIIREAELAQVAAERELRVASDVFEVEPLPASSPLWQIPGIIVSPHVGGPTNDRTADCGEVARRNVERFLTGAAPEGLITEVVFERST